MTIHKCDRCKKEVMSDELERWYKPDKPMTYMMVAELCGICVHEFREWVKERHHVESGS